MWFINDPGRPIGVELARLLGPLMIGNGLIMVNGSEYRAEKASSA